MEMSSYFFDPHQRLFWLYLLASLLLATLMVVLNPKLKSYFSKEVLWHDSAKMDYLYFVVVSLVKVVVILPLLIGAKDVSLFLGRLLQEGFGYQSPLMWNRESVVLFYTFTLFVVGDFTRYWLHRWLHSVPFLWCFHRLHHSAEVLNPLTFYRVHPVENILFGLRHAMSAGVVTALFIYVFGAKIGTVEFFGANIFVFVFGMLGANLRHSHIPLRYGVFESLLVSPYMHQLHHTKEYSSKNFGGVLSLWDRMFGSWHVAHTQESHRYGLEEGNPHTTLVKMFVEPFSKKFSTRNR